MKKKVKFLLLQSDVGLEPCGEYLPIALMQELKKKWPQFFVKGKTGFNFSADLGDPVINEVTTYLEKTGRQAHWASEPRVPWSHPTLFQIEGERVWEPEDFDQASYFRWVMCSTEAGKGKFLPPDGLFEVEFSSYRGKKIGSMQNGWNPFCSVEYKKELEAQHFKGMTFRPVHIRSRKPEKLELWQVWSTVTLPPVLNEVTGTKGEPFAPTTSKTCGINDIYFPYQYRFPAAKIAVLEPFDIALTTERWGGEFPHTREPALIVSRRFREWFMTQKVPVEWWPVALE